MPVKSSKMNIQGGPKKRGHKNTTGRFLGKFSVKWLLKIPPHFAYVATLPCETLMPAEQVINNRLQGNVATHLRYGEVFNNQIKKGLLLSLQVNFF